MKSIGPAVLAVLLIAVALPAQQPNTPGASMVFNGLDGPPFPITGATFPLGVANTVQLSGLPNAPFVAFASNDLLPNGFVVFGTQIVDLVPGNLTEILNGISSPFYRLNSSGQWSTQVTLTAPGATLNSRAAFQTMIANPSAPQGVSLTAATRVTVVPGVTTLPLTLGDDTASLVNLAPYNFQVPFYGTSYSNFWVGSNGFVTFTAQNLDYTPTPAEHLAQQPRIAGFWCDLNPGGGGTVTVDIDQTSMLSLVRVNFNNVAEFGGTGPPHTFSMDVNILGAINIIASPFNLGPPTYTCLVGLSPGNNQSPTTTVTDLSVLQTTPFNGMPNQAIFEWFGTASAANWPTPSSPNPYDLTGKTVYYFPQGNGYIATSF